jgi:hypothetical protein
MLDAICARQFSQLITLHYIASSQIGLGQMESHKYGFTSHINTPIRSEYLVHQTGCDSSSLAYLFSSLHAKPIEKMRNERIFNNKQTSRRKFQWLVAQDIELWDNRTPDLKEELHQWGFAIQN